ncbi:helix-turn-helix domain-containing protein [Novosphingobium sp. PP1Y]|uniref:helix-turn-helix domain-containing protein n=1 Tax=Novosphingobium sp. PP1Y TaxID=702113 RepID=UPI0002FF9770|nr:helix-turn-helix domain-containing protein [Novosphingobium sp. PP1Y]
MDTLPELMTLADFRRRYSISNSQVYREVQAGRLRIRKLGAASRIARTDAEAWAEGLPIVEGDAA